MEEPLPHGCAHTHARTHRYTVICVHMYASARLARADVDMCMDTYVGGRAHIPHTQYAWRQHTRRSHWHTHVHMSTHRQVRMSPVRMGLWGLLPARKGKVSRDQGGFPKHHS